MIAFGIGILLLIKSIKLDIPDVTQSWYTSDAGDLGTFTRLEAYFDLLTRQGLVRGCHPKPFKSVLIVRPENIEAGKVFGACHIFKVCTGARYIGGYIRDDKSKRDWLRDRMLT